jgi:hypothetical protein
MFIKDPNIKFHGNPSSGGRADTCGQTDGRTDMTKLINDFGDYADAPKIGYGTVL